MALIAPGAFLWLTFYIQATTGVADLAPAMWLGIFASLLLCLATAVAYAEISKLYPGTGSSYYYAEQAMLSKDDAFKYARLAKFIVGWGSHLYYWVYPGVMVATTGIFVGYVVGFLYPSFISGSNPGPRIHGPDRDCLLLLRGLDRLQGRRRFDGRQPRHQRRPDFCAHCLQRSRPRLSLQPSGRVTPPTSTTDRRSPPTPTSSPRPKTAPSCVTQAARLCPCSARMASRFHLPSITPATDATRQLPDPQERPSVVSAHNLNWMFIQATVAILILVGFESVTSMGGEAKNPTKHIPIAVIASLLIQGLFCYLFEYFCANYFLNSGYTMQSAASSAAPIGDMMIIVGDGLLGHGNGKYFMLVEAFTVFLALIGTTLSCMNTGARVTYAMGKDEEVPEHFGMLHAGSLSPRRAIWTLACISAVIGCVAVSLAFGDAGAPTDAAIAALPHGIFSSFGYSSHATMAGLPNSLLTITLTSNFGTFILYALSCFLCIVAFHKRPDHSFLRHTLIPGFGLLANIVCMAFYLISPVFGLGTFKEPLLALGISAVWGIYGAIYFLRSSKAKGKSVLLESKRTVA